MLGSAQVIRGDARSLPLADNSVDLCVTSPPYWSLRAYTDGGQAYAGQIGSEADDEAYLDDLLVVFRECARVVKPTGSIFWNLGDKYGPDKSLRLLPQRFAERVRRGEGGDACIVRAEIIWSKPNGL